MGSGRKRGLYRAIATMLSLTMVLGRAGCGTGSGVESSVEMSQASDKDSAGTESSQPLEKETTDFTEGSKTSENSKAAETSKASEEGSASTETAKAQFPEENVAKEYVYDFDELVNAEWIAENKGAHPNGYSKIWYYWDMMYEHLYDIMDNADLSALDPESGIYKALSIYREQRDPSTRDKKVNQSIKARLDRIDNIKSLQDLYDLYADEEFARYDRILYASPQSTETGAYSAMVMPLTVTSDYEPMNVMQESALRAGLTGVGVSSKRASEIIKNAKALDEIILKFYDNITSENYAYITQSMLNNHGVTVPVIDILDQLGSIGDSKTFLSVSEYYDLLNTIYQPDNLQLIKDHFAATAILRLAPYATKDVAEKYCSLMYETTNPEAVLKDYLDHWMFAIASDMFAQEYDREFVRDPALDAEAKAMLEDIKVELKVAFKDFPWTYPYSNKAFIEQKIDALQVLLGANEAYNDLADVVLTDDPIDDMVAFLVSGDRFSRRVFHQTLADRAMTGINMFDANGYYDYTQNKIMLCSGWLSMYADLKKNNLTYEEVLGTLGTVIAHEAGHAFSRNAIGRDHRGIYRNWMYDGEYECIMGYYDSIETFFDGIDVGFDCKLVGEDVIDETIADLIGVGCCLRLLAKQEHPDYDLFFRTYAAQNVAFYSAKSIKEAATEGHLPGKERINYVLGQFDEFYRTYDVDKTSPYYVPQEKRLKGLW